MGLFDIFKEAFREPTKYELEEVEFIIYSASHYQENIDKLMSNSMQINNRYILETYSEKNLSVWKYDAFKPKKVNFISEPKNEYDPNAIRIVVKNMHIGYIPQKDNVKFKKWLDENRIYNTNLVICGGDKKTITKNGIETSKNDYKVVLRFLLKTDIK